ncbi:hypothetical protein DOY81_010882, partial [Sarcophaga bullata]
NLTFPKGFGIGGGGLSTANVLRNKGFKSITSESEEIMVANICDMHILVPRLTDEQCGQKAISLHALLLHKRTILYNPKYKEERKSCSKTERGRS